MLFKGLGCVYTDIGGLNMAHLGTKKGFTLVEALISLVLIVMVLGGSYALVSQSTRGIYLARHHYVAVNIARARIERIRNFTYNQIISLTETNVVVDDSGIPSSEGYFRRSTLINTNYAPGLTKVEVITDIRDIKSLTFKGNYESVASLFTEYLTE